MDTLTVAPPTASAALSTIATGMSIPTALVTAENTAKEPLCVALSLPTWGSYDLGESL